MRTEAFVMSVVWDKFLLIVKVYDRVCKYNRDVHSFVYAVYDYRTVDLAQGNLSLGLI